MRFLEPVWTSLPGRIRSYLLEIGFSSGADICNIFLGGNMDDILFVCPHCDLLPEIVDFGESCVHVGVESCCISNAEIIHVESPIQET